MAKPEKNLKTDEASAAVEVTTAPAPAPAADAADPGPGTATAVAEAPAPVEVPGATALEVENDVPLADFCERFAEGYRQKHAVTAFYDEEDREGRGFDKPSAYQSRFDAMMQRPAR